MTYNILTGYLLHYENFTFLRESKIQQEILVEKGPEVEVEIFMIYLRSSQFLQHVVSDKVPERRIFFQYNGVDVDTTYMDMGQASHKGF